MIYEFLTFILNFASSLHKSIIQMNLVGLHGN